TYDPAIESDAETAALARNLVACALNFYRDFIEPGKTPYVPNQDERDQLRELADFLHANPDASAEAIEKIIYDLGRAHYEKPGHVFAPIYRVLLGQERGPRLGVFIRLATPEKIAAKIEAALM
ncbi:MAG: lysine--tRNA ligase, partial [Candidatus Binataceae bacterium]